MENKTLYPIDEQIARFLESVYDPETGELYEGISEEDLELAIGDLQIAFDDKIKSLRNAYLATSLDAECVAAEASALYKRQQEVSKRAKAIQNRAERIKRFIAWLLQGENFQKDGCKISFTRRQNTVIDDGFVEWALQNGREYLNAPEVRKADVTAAMKSGKNFEFAHQETKTYINIK